MKQAKRMKRFQVTLDEETIIKLKSIALGNISMAIRIAVRDFSQKIKKS